MRIGCGGGIGLHGYGWRTIPVSCRQCRDIIYRRHIRLDDASSRQRQDAIDHHDIEHRIDGFDPDQRDRGK